MRIELGSTCISGVSGPFSIADSSGTLTIASIKLKLLDPTQSTSRHVSVTMRRQRKGAVDSALNPAKQFSA